MFDRFTQRGRKVVVLAQDAGWELAHPHIGTEHLLLGELAAEEGLGAWALESLGLQRETTTATLAGLVPPTRTPPPGTVPFTAGARCALELTLVEVQSRRLEWVNTEHLLLGVCAEVDVSAEHDVARRLLAELGVTTDQIRAALSPYISEPPVVLSWSLRHASELEFRDLPGSAWSGLMPLPADLRLRRLLVDSAAVALGSGRRVIESSDLVAASEGVPSDPLAGFHDAPAGVAGGDLEWESIEAGRPVVSALVGAGRVASTRGGEAVTVEDLFRSLRVHQRALLARAGRPLEPPAP